MYVMAHKATTIKAVLNKDLENLLIQTNQLNEFVGGEIKCIYCGTSISYDNLSIIIPSVKDGSTCLRCCCNNPDCLSKYRSENE